MKKKSGPDLKKKKVWPDVWVKIKDLAVAEPKITSSLKKTFFLSSWRKKNRRHPPRVQNNFLAAKYLPGPLSLNGLSLSSGTADSLIKKLYI